MPREIQPGYDFYSDNPGLEIESYGSLHTDIYGLSTATAVWTSPAHRINYPSMRSPHPLWNFMHVEKRTVNVENTGICRTVCEYAGFEGVPIPIIEWSSGVSEEPIQTHPNFTGFAGTPSHPLNGAVFVNASDLTTPSTDDTPGKAVFVRFAGDGAFAGVTGYLSPCLIKRVTQLSPNPINVSATVGHLQGSMLKVSATSIQRGIVFQNSEEFRGPGRRGWNAAIYG